MRDPQVLFSKFDWFSIDQQQRTQLVAEINELDGDRLLNTSVDDLCDYFEKKYRVEVPVLRQDEIVADQRETQMDIRDYQSTIRVKGTTVELAVPFDGDGATFNVQPSSYTSSPPRGEVRDGVLMLRVVGADLAADKVRAAFDRSRAVVSGGEDEKPAS